VVFFFSVKLFEENQIMMLLNISPYMSH